MTQEKGQEKELPGAEDLELRTLVLLTEVVIDTLQHASPRGVPGGWIYSALLTAGVTKPGFDILMAIICEAGFARKEGDLYYHVKEGPTHDTAKGN